MDHLSILSGKPSAVSPKFDDFDDVVFVLLVSMNPLDQIEY